MENASSQNDLRRIEIFGEPVVNRVLGESRSRLTAVIVIWVVFALIPLVSYVIATSVDGSFTIDFDAAEVLRDFDFTKNDDGSFTLYRDPVDLKEKGYHVENNEDGTFTFDSDPVGLANDFTLFVALILTPVVASGMVIIFPKFSQVLLSLWMVIARKESPGASRDGVERLSLEQFNEKLKSYEDNLKGRGKSKILAALLFAIWLADWAFLTIQHWDSIATYGNDWWSSQNYLTSFVVRTIYEFFLYCVAIPYFLFKLVSILHIMRSSCIDLSQYLKIRPLNPDKAGGLGMYGAYSLRLMSLASLPFIMVVAYVLFISVNSILMVVFTGYMVLLAIIFFYPLSGAHRAMRKVKGETLRSLSEEFTVSYDRFMETMKDKSAQTSWADFDEADKLNKLYATAQSMPIWPFNLATVSKFATIMGTVALTVWLKFILDRLSGG